MYVHVCKCMGVACILQVVIVGISSMSTVYCTMNVGLPCTHYNCTFYGDLGNVKVVRI